MDEKNLFITKENFENILKEVNKNYIVKITCNLYVYGICATEILKNIFKKELIKYELKFEQMSFTINLKLKIGNILYILDNTKFCDDLCKCKKTLIGCYGILMMAKNMNFISSSVIWPFLIVYGFYIDYDFTMEFCNWCKNLKNELQIITANIYNKKSIGIHYVDRTLLPFLNQSTLLFAIKHNIEIVCSKKLFCKYNKSISHRYIDKKIYEFLAKGGISITTANELYTNLDDNEMLIIKNNFGTDKIYVYRYNYEYEIQPIEHFFLISYYLNIKMPMEAFLCLNKKELYTSEKYLMMVDSTFELFKQLIQNVKKADNIIMFLSKLNINYFIKNSQTIDCNLIEILLKMIKIYLEMKYDNNFISIIILEENEIMFLYSNDCKFEKITNDLIIKRYDKSIQIKSSCLKNILKQLLFLEDIFE